MRKEFLFAVIGLVSAYAQCPQIHFAMDTLRLGSLDQGSIRHYDLSIYNDSQEQISLSDAYAQGRGPINIKFPSQIGIGQKGQISFDFETKDLNGSINENISFQGSQICLYPLPIQGHVQPALQFWPPQLNLGSLKVGDNLPKFTVYAWDPRGKGKLTIDPQTKEYFDVKVSSVAIETNPDGVVEKKVGKPAYKIELQLKKIPTSPNGRRSVSLLLPFRNSNFPDVFNEIYAVGWLGEIPSAKNQ